MPSGSELFAVYALTVLGVFAAGVQAGLLLAIRGRSGRV